MHFATIFSFQKCILEQKFLQKSIRRLLLEISFPNHLPLPFFFLKEIYKEKGFLFPSPSSYSFVKKSERLKSMCAMCAMSTISFIEEVPQASC